MTGASARAAEHAASQRRGRVLAGTLAALALVAAALLAGPPGGDEEPLDPRSAAPDGLGGLVELAEAMGTQVDIATDLPSDTSIRLLVPADGLRSGLREDLLAWVRRGGHLVVSDPRSGLHDLDAVGGSVSDLVGPSTRSPDCALPALAEVEAVSHAGWTGFEVADDAQEVACFADGSSPWLVARSVGEGSLVALGSPAPLLNRSLDRDDNAVLAAVLLFPHADARLQVLPPSAASTGDGTPGDPGGEVALEDLLPSRVLAAGAVALLGVLLALLAVGRRLGQPVGERLPPTVPSAELARSVGDLLQRAGHRDGAAARLRGEARQAVGGVLGGELEPEALARRVHQRLGVDLEVARAALVDLEVATDDDLVGVAAAVADLRDHLAAAT